MVGFCSAMSILVAHSLMCHARKAFGAYWSRIRTKACAKPATVFGNPWTSGWPEDETETVWLDELNRTEHAQT
jgi:hypothetical protein